MDTPTHGSLYTMNIRDEEPLFFNEELAERACRIIRNRCNFGLISFVVMPDHLHVLFHADSVDESRDMAHILRRSFDTVSVLDEQGISDFYSFPVEIEKTKKYVEENPVRSRLCDRPEEYRWSSANSVAFPQLTLPDEGSWLPGAYVP